MTPSTLNTILNSAPIIIQGAGKLIKLIRDRETETKDEEDALPLTIEGLKLEVQKMESRLNANSASDIEQIRLIEQLAKQNETMAATLSKTLKQLNIVIMITLAALAISIAALVLLLIS